MTAPRRFLPVALLALSLAASAQTMVEHTAATANAAAAAGMGKAGKSAATVAEKAVKALDKAGAAQTSSSSAVVLSGPAAKPETAVKFSVPDPAAVPLGMDREELLRKFGPPAMKTSSAEGSQSAETWWYASGAESLEVKLADGKVRAVTPRKADPNVAVLP